MSDAATLGARIESLTKQCGLGMMVRYEPRNAVQNVIFRKLDMVQMKGNEKPVTAYESFDMAGKIPAETG